ncbi:MULTISPECIES: DUF1439 domain-containing protein [Ferrimonas]|uniref:DUF1439 domain-containing protein n=1 Tax=Ferrimonas TaxID=44011 RepID=UPI00041D0A83|nr:MULTISPECIES: DUF1439 domain-containing protein [Ferrimonas]USD37878.1 DUF1439 domain-containing protein [Ferrimonas sp. SCSIO 43195]
MRWLLIPWILALTGCATSYTLTENELQDYLSDNMTVQQRQSPLPFVDAEMTLNRIDVAIGRSGDNVEVSTVSELVIRTPLLPIRASLTATLSAVPWYRPEDQSIYLRDLQVVEITATPKELNGPLQQLSSQSLTAVQLFLSNQPIYTLDQKDWKQELLAQFGRELTIEPGALRFHLRSGD